jgi:hypothetical protein
MAICEYCGAKEGVRTIGGSVDGEIGIHLCGVCQTCHVENKQAMAQMVDAQAHGSHYHLDFATAAVMQWLIPRLLD